MTAFTTGELRSFIERNFPQVDPAAAFGIAASLENLDTTPLETCEAFSGFCPSHPHTAIENILKRNLCTPRTIFPHSFDPERDGWICPAQTWQIADALTDLVRYRRVADGGISVSDFVERLRENSTLLGLKFSEEEGLFLADVLDDADGETDGVIDEIPTKIELEKFAANVFPHGDAPNILFATNVALDLNSEIVPAKPKPALPSLEKMETMMAGVGSMNPAQIQLMLEETGRALTAIQTAAQTHCPQGNNLQKFIAQIAGFQTKLADFQTRTRGETVGNVRGALRPGEVRVIGTEITQYWRAISDTIKRSSNAPLQKAAVDALTKLQTVGSRLFVCNAITNTPATGQAIAATGAGTISSGSHRAIPSAATAAARSVAANVTRGAAQAARRRSPAYGVALRTDAIAEPRVRAAVLIAAAGAALVISGIAAYFLWQDDDDNE